MTSSPDLRSDLRPDLSPILRPTVSGARRAGRGATRSRDRTSRARPFRILRPLRTVLLVVLALAGCRGDTGGELQGFRMDVATAPTPPVVGPSRIVVTLTDGDGVAVAGAGMRLEGTMTHAGMVPVIREAVPDGGGRYRVDDFEFTMGGDWILRAHVTLSDGRAGILERELRVVSAPDR